MTDFTTLFAATLNSTISAMVAEAMIAPLAEIETLKNQIVDLEDHIKTLVDAAPDECLLEKAVTAAIEEHDFTAAMETVIEQYEFKDIVNDSVDIDRLIDDDRFDDAVREVIVNALRR